MAATRTYDIVLYGATGFTGRLTADYLARHAPQGCRWALAGRSQGKLEELAHHLSGTTSDPSVEIGCVVADSSDPGSLERLAADTRVLVTTVGPYLRLGTPLVAACAAAGTDYLDLTGEPEFVDRTYVQFHEQASQSGARLIHCCGFDSIPHDIGAYYTLLQLPEGVPVTIDGYVRFGGRPSSGTIQSALGVAGRLPQLVQSSRDRRRAEASHLPAGRRVSASAGRPHRFDGGWAVPAPTIDPQVIGYSARLAERYGPEFTYRHHAVVEHLAPLAGVAVGAVPALIALQVPAVRKALVRRFPSGEGPSEEQRARSSFEVVFVGRGGTREVRTRFAGGDPGYGETAKMLSESALCIAFEQGLPEMAGQVTTAAAMGDALIPRLQQAGLSIEIIAGP